MSFITALSTATPPHSLSQAAAAEWAKAYHQAGPALARVIDSVHKASGISQRYTAISDYLSTDPKTWQFFGGGNPGTAARMEAYRQQALPLARGAAEGALKERGISGDRVSHVILASCTGMYAPGLELDLMEALGINAGAERTAIHYMGCHAAVNVLKTARHIARSEPDAVILCVCVELCTLHKQEGTDRNSLLSSTLFADGAAAAIVEGAPRSDGLSLALSAFKSSVAFHGRNEMAWNIGDNGFQMALTAYVPALIEEGIPALAHSMAEELADSRVGHWAIHPGGKRIVEACGSALGLSEHDLRHSYGVLNDFGNMSSPTVLFVLDRIRRQISESGDMAPIFGAAFGPGLAMETMLLHPIARD